MKCPSCGAEIGNNRVCDYCGTPVPSEMIKEIEQQNKQGCPKCGSTNIIFEREEHGEIKDKKSRQRIYKTVGVCKDCGHTWVSSKGVPKKRKTWLWILGWIFIFPVPLTILMLRKKEMKPALKYGIIAVAWLVYFALVFNGNSSDQNSTTPEPANKMTFVETREKEKAEEATKTAAEASEASTENKTEIKKEEKTEEKEEEKADSDGVDPEFKRQMDAYEAFFDQYIEFMENYDASDLSALTEYAALMEKYSEYVQEIDDIDENSLSPADSAYYLEVNARILKKLERIQ